MRLSLKYVTPFLVAGAVAVACSASEDSPGGGGTGGSAQTPKGGGTSTGGIGTTTGGIAQGGTGNTAGKANTGGSTAGGNTAGGTAAGGTAAGGTAAGGNAAGGKSNTGGSAAGGSANTGGSAGGAAPGGGGSGGAAGGVAGGTGGGSGNCLNTDTSKINLDASGYVCNNSLGIKGAWYCYSDGSDSGTSCKGSDGKGTGAIPWNTTATAMCMSGTMGTGDGKYAGIGFKLNSGPPGDMATPGTWDGSGKVVGFAVTLGSGPSGKGSGGMVLNLEYPTSTNLDPQTKDAPGVTLPGVGATDITYNVLFNDAVLANNPNNNTSVDPSKLTDIKLAFFPDSVQHAYDFCIKSIVPLTTAPNPVVPVGNYGPTWTNQTPQAVNGINGYAVQSAPFPTAGNPMTMQVKATAGGVGFTYTAGANFQAPNNGPGSFPAIINGYGPGHDGIQFYGSYKGGKTIGQLTNVKSSWSFTMGSTGNAVYDVWFSNSNAAIPAAELMIWIGNTGKNPLGSQASGGAIGGRTPYVGTNGTGEQVISYWIASPGTTSVSNFDLLPYFQDAASKGYAGLSSNSVLLGVQTGFEVYAGTWTTTDYNITIQ